MSDESRGNFVGPCGCSLPRRLTQAQVRIGAALFPSPFSTLDNHLSSVLDGTASRTIATPLLLFTMISTSARTGVDLCLACSSSLPPRRSSASKSSSPDIFVTQCCSRMICSACISENPRLSRYNPCLHCLSGVGIVNARSRVGSAQVAAKLQNLDGGLHDDEVYTIGDDDEDEGSELEAVSGEISPSTPSTPPPVYTELDEAAPQDADTQESGPECCVQKSDQENEDTTEASDSAPSVHYIQPKDTLIGIALRFGVDVSGAPYSVIVLPLRLMLGPSLVPSK